MDEKYLQFLETLSAKLGTTVEHIWGILLRQAPISAAVDLMLLISITASTVYLVKFVARKTKKPGAVLEEEAAFASWIAVIFVVLFNVIVVVCTIPDIVAALANPEYWALKQLLAH